MIDTSPEACEIEELEAALILAIVHERESFHRDYRIKCYAETKRLETELTALRKLLQEWQNTFGMDCGSGEFGRIYQRTSDALAKLEEK
jgi:hypothetical protein